MYVGNLLALMQENLERLLAYSSIAHLGYLFTAALALGDTGARAAMYYLVAYSVTILGAFGIISLLSTATGEPEYIDDYRGLFWERPALAAVMAVMMFSLAGIPLTAGFLGKLYVLLAGIGGGVWGLAVALVIGSALGLFYYLRVIVAMFSTPPAATHREFELRRVPAAGQVVLAVLVVALVALGGIRLRFWRRCRRRCRKRLSREGERGDDFVTPGSRCVAWGYEKKASVDGAPYYSAEKLNG
jgi:NADH-quinone oxidoreductase subunit N